MTIRGVRKGSLAGAMLLAVVACGTTGDRPYRYDGERNFSIASETEPSTPGEVRATFLYVHAVTPNCELDYLGHLRLDKPALQTGLPIGRPLLLTAEFVNRPRFSESTLRNSHSYFFTVRSGHDYTADVRHESKSYKFVLWDRRRGGGPKRLLEHRDLDTCARSR